MSPRRLAGPFALVAMVPLALNPSLLVARTTLAVALCNGAGPGGVVRLPLGPARLPGDTPGHCCDKACHGAGSRKRVSAAI